MPITATLHGIHPLSAAFEGTQSVSASLRATENVSASLSGSQQMSVNIGGPKGISVSVGGSGCECSPINIDETLKYENGVLSVNTANAVEANNTLPVTSAAVSTTVGNIEILLATI